MPSSAGHRVEFRLLSGRRAVCCVPATDHVLAAARAAGIELPSLCEQGWCCVCAVRVLAGRVDQADSRRFFEQDRQAGFALICTGRALTDLVVETHALPAIRAHRLGCGLPVPHGTTLPTGSGS